MPHKLSPRFKTFDYLGFYRYFLTICTCDRIPIFLDDQSVDLGLLHLSRTADDHRFAVIAYCFMPNHVHLLIEGTHPAAEFREFVRIFKQRSSFAWKQRNGTALWQRSYFERVLRDDEDTIAVAKYILENPVRGNLVQRPEDYPYLGSMTMAPRELLYSVQIEGGPKGPPLRSWRSKADLKVRLYVRGVSAPRPWPHRSARPAGCRRCTAALDASETR